MVSTLLFSIFRLVYNCPKPALAMHVPVLDILVKAKNEISQFPTYGVHRLGSRGNMDAFRTLSRPKYKNTTRSRPIPAPA
jgi:hypothetical protein